MAATSKATQQGWTTIACRPDLRYLLGVIAKSINSPMSTMVDGVLVDAITDPDICKAFSPEVKKAIYDFQTGRRGLPPQG